MTKLIKIGLVNIFLTEILLLSSVTTKTPYVHCRKFNSATNDDT